MSADDNTSGAPKPPEDESEVWNAIVAFEQILEAIPTDRASLAALSHAYEQIGDHARAAEYLIRLANVLLDDADIDPAGKLLTKLESYGDYPDVQEVMQRIHALVADQQPQGEGFALAIDTVASDQPVATAKVSTKQATFSIEDELAMAWDLLEAEEFTQEEYSGVVQDLSDMSASDSPSTVSVLHVLEARNFSNLERVVGKVARESDTPYVSLSSYDIPDAASMLLPLDFMIKRGVMVFEVLGDEALVAVMNPNAKKLRSEVREVLGRICHFYVTLPSEFDQHIQRVRDELESHHDGAPKA